MPNSNLELLKLAAEQLRPILNELVFVGGCTTGLFVTDPAAAEVRSTVDVDAIVEITSYAEYAIFSDRLRRLGFEEDMREDAPTCRWLKDGTILDVMPIDERILGFSNRWYQSAMESAQEQDIESGLRIRVVTASYFCATKLEAFEGRGNRDYLASHDLEDLVTVVNGREELIDEWRTAPEDLRQYVSDAIKGLLETERFIDALPDYVSEDEDRVGILLERLRQISEPYQRVVT
jgi:hypothetical protein